MITTHRQELLSYEVMYTQCGIVIEGVSDQLSRERGGRGGTRNEGRGEGEAEAEAEGEAGAREERFKEKEAQEERFKKNNKQT